MSTFSSSFSVSYTLTGNLNPLPISDGFSWGAVILPRGPLYFQLELARKLVAYGAREVILRRDSGWVAGEPLPRDLPVKFLIPSVSITEPLWMQLALGASRSEWMLVLADSMEVLEPFPPQKLARGDSELEALVYIPELKSPSGEEIPYLIVPLKRGRVLQFINIFPQHEFHESLYPMDLAGFYRPNTFLQTGGFDPLIANPYWQKVDWGFRIHLWGESVRYLRGFRVQYQSVPPEEDTTPVNGYERFYLKNIVPRYNLDHVELPLSQFFSFLAQSGLSPLRAWRTFRDVRRWLRSFGYRYRMDAVALKQLWREWG